MRAATAAAPVSRIAALSHEISKSGRFSLRSRPMNRPSAFPLTRRPSAKNTDRNRTTDQQGDGDKGATFSDSGPSGLEGIGVGRGGPSRVARRCGVVETIHRDSDGDVAAGCDPRRGVRSIGRTDDPAMWQEASTTASPSPAAGILRIAARRGRAAA